MKNLNDLGLNKKSRKKVEDWLTEWLDLFIRQANGKTGWPYRADFEKDDFFYFTDCKDILKENPESKGQELNRAIVNRKRKVMLQLLMKTLLGRKNICDVITCGHCGYKGGWIESLSDGNGHWVYCPWCKKTDVHVFPDGYDNCMTEIQFRITDKLLKATVKGFTPPPGSPVDMNKVNSKEQMKFLEDGRKIIEKKQLYKYKPEGKQLTKTPINPDPRLKDIITKKTDLSPGLKKILHNKLLHRKRICDKCGSKGPFDYAVEICNDCYRGEILVWFADKR